MLKPPNTPIGKSALSGSRLFLHLAEVLQQIPEKSLAGQWAHIVAQGHT